MDGDRGGGQGHQRLGILRAQGLHIGEREAGRDVAIDQVVRGGLVGDHVRHDAACGDLGEDLRGVSGQPDREGAFFAGGGLCEGECFVEGGGLALQIAVGDAPGDPCRIHLDAQDDGAGEGSGERLGAAHAAQACGQDQASCEVGVEMTFGDADEDLVGALHHALRADILPVAGGQAAPADQVAVGELVEILCRRPLADHVAVGHDHDRRPGMGAQQADGFAGLDDQRLVLVHGGERLDDLGVRGPVARGLAEGCVDDELVGVFCDGEDVFEQAQQAFLAPAAAAQVGAAGYGEVILCHQGARA